MQRYLYILRREIPTLEAEDLERPITDLGIDSIDIVVLRAALEKHFGVDVPDAVWYRFSTLEEALQYFHGAGNENSSTVQEENPLEHTNDQEIGMLQMANSALSESWLLKELGAMHWALLTKGLEQPTSSFRDETGNRLYATFVRIRYRTTPLSSYRENAVLQLQAGIERFGKSTYLSKVKGSCDDNHLEAQLMTTFSVREGVDNEQVRKSNPLERVNHVPELAVTPLFLNEYRLLRKGFLMELESPFGAFALTDNSIWRCSYAINPYYDVNGVGLLYFAAYPVIADKCLYDYCKAGAFAAILNWHTVYRDTFYFANCNPGDVIRFHLHTFEQMDAEHIKIAASLYRGSDGVLLARTFAVKAKQGPLCL